MKVGGELKTGYTYHIGTEKESSGAYLRYRKGPHCQVETVIDNKA